MIPGRRGGGCTAGEPGGDDSLFILLCIPPHPMAGVEASSFGVHWNHRAHGILSEARAARKLNPTCVRGWSGADSAKQKTHWSNITKMGAGIFGFLVGAATALLMMKVFRRQGPQRLKAPSEKHELSKPASDRHIEGAMHALDQIATVLGKLADPNQAPPGQLPGEELIIVEFNTTRCAWLNCKQTDEHPNFYRISLHAFRESPLGISVQNTKKYSPDLQEYRQALCWGFSAPPSLTTHFFPHPTCYGDRRQPAAKRDLTASGGFD